MNDRNRTKYKAASPDAKLEAKWNRTVKRNPLNTAYASAKGVSLSRAAIRCKDFRKALEALAAVTGDIRFQACAQAMTDHAIISGDIKDRIMKAALEHPCFKAEWAAMPNVHLWVMGGASISHAAKMVAIELGIPGTSFANVFDRIRKRYPEWKAKIKPDG